MTQMINTNKKIFLQNLETMPRCTLQHQAYPLHELSLVTEALTMLILYQAAPCKQKDLPQETK